MFQFKMLEENKMRRRLSACAVDERLIDTVVEIWAGKTFHREDPSWMGVALLECVHRSGVVPDNDADIERSIAALLVKELIHDRRIQQASVAYLAE